MKLIVSEINHYWVHFQAGHKENVLIYPHAIIKCYHDDDFVMQASFYPDNKKLPENYHDVNSKLVYSSKLSSSKSIDSASISYRST